MRYWLNRKIVMTILALIVMFVAAVSVSATEASGNCGDGVQWSLSAGVLTISGKGAMADYDEFAPAPWYDYADEIQSVQVESGITSVGEFAFFRLGKLTAVTLADSVTAVDGWAFYDCMALELLDLGTGVKRIDKSAFERCIALMDVRLPDGLESIGDQVFYRCKSLMSITVPASVTYMGTEVFTYCSNLASATVLANVETLPRWTFYGCEDLCAVTMGSGIKNADEGAFEKCDSLPDSFQIADVPQNVDITTSTQKVENGQTVTTDNHYTQQGGSTVNVQTTKTQTESMTNTQVEVNAVLEKQESWDHLESQITDAQFASGGELVDVTINLKGNAVISGENLGAIAGKDVQVTILTQDGTRWHINGKDLSADALQELYQLGFELKLLTDPTEEHLAAIGNANAFILVFDKDINFKVEVEVPVGAEYARDTAAFFAPGDEGYERMQAVVIDDAGFAHFYIGVVQSNAQYLIGINVTNEEEEGYITDAIIPDVLKDEHPEMEQIEQIEYVVIGTKSSWGIDIGQLTWILAGGMIGSFVIVGFVMFVIFKRKLKRGYVPDMRYEDELEE